MKFIKDILFIEMVTTGDDPEKNAIIQLSGILLDKDNLLEKLSFNSYIRVSLLENTIRQHANMLGIEESTLQKSGKIFDVAKKFHEYFGTDVMLATHNVRNILFLKQAYKKANVPFDYDVHIVELWTLGYIYALSYGIKKMPTLNTLLDHFRLKMARENDAFERVRLEIAVFKKIIGHA